jgi:hypothetical protein
VFFSRSISSICGVSVCVLESIHVSHLQAVLAEKYSLSYKFLCI